MPLRCCSSSSSSLMVSTASCCSALEPVLALGVDDAADDVVAAGDLLVVGARRVDDAAGGEVDAGRRRPRWCRGRRRAPMLACVEGASGRCGSGAAAGRCRTPSRASRGSTLTFQLAMRRSVPSRSQHAAARRGAPRCRAAGRAPGAGGRSRWCCRSSDGGSISSSKSAHRRVLPVVAGDGQRLRLGDRRGRAGAPSPCARSGTSTSTEPRRRRSGRPPPSRRGSRRWPGRRCCAARPRRS